MVAADEASVGEEEGGSAGHGIGEVDEERQQHEYAEDQHVRQQEEGRHAADAEPALHEAERRIDGAHQQAHGHHDRLAKA
ncbi:hypothetical protein D9M68_275240 [compost metagenome]